MKRSFYSNEMGSALICALFGAGVILWMFALLVFHGYNAQKLMSSSSHFREAKLASKNETEIRGLNVPGYFCQDEESIRGEIQIKKSLCGLRFVDSGALPHAIVDGKRIPAGSFPLLDTTQLFRGETPCTVTAWNYSSKTPGNFLITTGSSIPSTLCELDASTIGTASSFRSNLSASRVVTISNGGTTRLDSLGFLEFSKLVVNSDSILVAGGDLRIQLLTGGGAARATFISLTGVVSIDRIEGIFSGKFIGKEGVQILTPIPDRDNGLLPPLEIQRSLFFK